MVMRLLIVALALACAADLGHAQAPATAPLSCDPVGAIRFVCGLAGPEDLVAVPNSPWLVASAYGAQGGIHLVDTRAGTASRVYPSLAAPARLDRAMYAECPGPIAAGAADRYQTHGLFLKEGRGAPHTLYVVYHGVRESIEIFELDTRSGPPALTWVGCVVAPDPIGLNAVVALPDGGLAATNFQSRPPAGAGRGGPFSPELISGQNNGEVWEWHPRAGWAKVPGSEAAGANGLEISQDGQWYYVAQWGNRSFMRLSRGRTPVVRDVIPLGFRVDNVRWAPDRTLYVAGQGGGDAFRGTGAGPAASANAGPQASGPQTSVIGKVDVRTMTYRAIIEHPTSTAVSFATVAVQIGDELWVGSSRGDRVMRYPAAGLPR